MVMGGRDLVPTCWVIPVSCVNNAHVKAIRAVHTLKRKKGATFLLPRDASSSFEKGLATSTRVEKSFQWGLLS